MKGEKVEEENLTLAVSSGKDEIVNLLLDHGVNIERKCPYSMETPLMEAT